jgi:hypothetical protein
MRNAWKGLVVGGLTGVVAGVMLDALSESSRLAHAAGRRAARLAGAATKGAAPELTHVATNLAAAAKREGPELAHSVKNMVTLRSAS